MELFNEKGYVDVGVREIARALGISPGNLSYHFSKKEGMLIALLEQYREAKTKLYRIYFAGTSLLEHFLQLMKRLFESQYQYRGVFIGNQFVRAQIESGERFNYNDTYSQRVAAFTEIFKELNAAGQIKTSDEDISFLVSYMTLTGRFWIYEATLFNKSPEKEPTMKYYLTLHVRLLSLFATRDGLASINDFMKSNG